MNKRWLLILLVLLLFTMLSCNLLDSNCSCTIVCKNKPTTTRDGYCPVFPAWGECSYTEHCDKGTYDVYSP